MTAVGFSCPKCGHNVAEWFGLVEELHQLRCLGCELFYVSP